MVEFEIKDGVLINCTGEDSHVVIPDGVVKIGPNAFYDFCEGVSLEMPNSVIVIDNDAFCYAPFESISLSESLEVIGESAFADSCITSIVIPKGVQKIGKCVSKCISTFL